MSTRRHRTARSGGARLRIDATTMRALLLIALGAAGATFAYAAEPSVVPLMRDHKCYVCHADEEELAGPAFADVAAAYRGNPLAVPIVATFIRSGAQGAGPWHMPPHPEISAAEATAIARYILTLDQRPALRETGGAKPDQPASATSPGR